MLSNSDEDITHWIVWSVAYTMSLKTGFCMHVQTGASLPTILFLICGFPIVSGYSCFGAQVLEGSQIRHWNYKMHVHIKASKQENIQLTHYLVNRPFSWKSGGILVNLIKLITQQAQLVDN